MVNNTNSQYDDHCVLTGSHTTYCSSYYKVRTIDPSLIVVLLPPAVVGLYSQFLKLVATPLNCSL